MLKLLSMLGGGIAATLAAIIAWVGRKWGTTTAVITLMIALTVAMIGAINGILSGVISLASPPAWLSGALYMIPPDFTVVLSAIVSARICRAAYDLAMMKAQILASSN